MRSSIVVCPYHHVATALEQHSATHMLSVLGVSDRLPWPIAESAVTCRLQFDDTFYSTAGLEAPALAQVRRIVDFAREWNGRGTLLVHCRAGASRSPAAALIAAAAIGRADMLVKIVTAKSYFRPNARMLDLAAKCLDDPLLRKFTQAVDAPLSAGEWGPAVIQLS